MSYVPGDYILLDKHDTIVGVSGNTDFWDEEETMPAMNPNRTYLIAKVLVVQNIDPTGEVIRQELYEGEVEDHVLTLSGISR